MEDILKDVEITLYQTPALETIPSRIRLSVKYKEDAWLAEFVPEHFDRNALSCMFSCIGHMLYKAHKEDSNKC